MPRKKKITINTPQDEKFVPQEEEFVPKVEELAPPEEESFKQLGQKIREERIAKNLSLESVSGHLHIAVKILEAIEDGDPEKGPKPVFLRGLVRTYCQYLGIEKTDIVNKIDQLLKSDAQGKQQLKTLRPVIEIKESHPVRNILIFLVLVTGGYLLYSIYSYQITAFLAQDNNTKSESTNYVARDKVVEREKITVRDGEISKSSQSENQSKQEKTVSEKIATSAMEDSNQEKNDIDGISKTSSDSIFEKKGINDVLIGADKTSETLNTDFEINHSKPNQTNLSDLSQPEVNQELLDPPLTLEVEASEGTWISISVDGNEAKDIRLNEDEIHQLEAKKEYQLTLGNTNAVRILLNGREIETNRTHQLLIDWLIDKSFLP